MTAFALKLVALASMIIDHLGYTLFLSGNYPAGYIAMRSFGRIAFPIFAFLIVNGLEHTRSPLRYFGRLALFGALSQPFYALAFSSSSYGLYPFAAFELLSPNLNVFFTLALSLGVIAALDAVINAVRHSERVWGAAAVLLCACSAAVLLLPSCDYSFKGLALIVALYLTKSRRTAQAAVIAIWGVIVYGVIQLMTWNFVFGACIAAVPVLCYNGRRGAKARWFYTVYPLHLCALWLLCYLLSR